MRDYQARRLLNYGLDWRALFIWTVIIGAFSVLSSASVVLFRQRNSALSVLRRLADLAITCKLRGRRSEGCASFPLHMLQKMQHIAVELCRVLQK